MSVGLAIVMPPVWAQVYLGAARFLKYSLEDLGISSEIVDFDFYDSSKSVILGWHLMPEKFSPRTPYAIYQLEPFAHAHWRSEFGARRSLFERAAALWDYSTSNLEWLERQGLLAHWLPLTHHPSLHDITTSDCLSEYDILFTGVMTPRRQAIIERLTQRCCVYAHSRWGSELLHAISRSKIVLNIHQHHEPMPLEQPRVAYALNQGAFVLSESSTDEPYPFLPYAPYDELAERALELLFRPATLAAAHETLSLSFEQSRTLAHLEVALAPLLPT